MINSLLATVPAEVTTLMTDANTTFGDVKEFVLSVIAFFTLVGIVLWIRRRK